MIGPDAVLHASVGEGPGALAIQVGGFLALVLAVLGLVLISEDGLEGVERWTWTAIVVLAPLIGPLAYLRARR